MDLRILGDVLQDDSTIYRGVDRRTPYFVSHYSEDAPVNQAFFWYCDEGGELGSVHDLQKAKALVELYSQLIPAQRFEVIEVILNNRSILLNSNMLGFDLVAGRYSLLSWGLKFRNKPSIPAQVESLVYLIEDFFQPKLNKYGLFTTYEIASYCLQCMLATQNLYPNLWENEQTTFQIAGLAQVLL
jgi:hypothetical protein